NFSIKNIHDKNDVLISTKTSSGKSLCYQALPVLTKSSVLVFSPFGLNFTSIGKDNKDNGRVKKGDFDVMFTSPETVLGNKMWRTLYYVKGEGTKNSDPFRELFGKIGKVRSLCPGVPFLVLTATASKRTRQTIKKKLCMDLPVEIVECPDRVNIKLNVKVEKSS
ncbi:WRN-like protein, partial [Mya arenaria]